MTIPDALVEIDRLIAGFHTDEIEADFAGRHRVAEVCRIQIATLENFRATLLEKSA